MKTQCLIPPLICLSDYAGDFYKYEEDLYNAFVQDYLNKKLSYNGIRIAHKKHPLIKGKSCTYWHIISDGEEEEDREIDLRRCERVKWPAFIINNCIDTCDEILVWENKRGWNTRVLIWCREVEYLIVLDKRQEFLLLWTAYPVTRGHRKAKLLKEYHEYKAKTD